MHLPAGMARVHHPVCLPSPPLRLTSPPASFQVGLRLTSPAALVAAGKKDKRVAEATREAAKAAVAEVGGQRCVRGEGKGGAE